MITAKPEEEKVTGIYQDEENDGWPLSFTEKVSKESPTKSIG